MNILITGATGFIAQHFIRTVLQQVPYLELTLYSQRPALAKASYQLQYPTQKIHIINKLDATTPYPNIVLNLAGASIVKKPFQLTISRSIRSSRINFTARLWQQLQQYQLIPEVFLSASAVAIYGDHNQSIDETAPLLGQDFLGRLAQEWERTVIEGSHESQTRIAFLRFGFVLGQDGGMLKRLLPLYRHGLGMYLGTGTQYVPWVSINDVVQAIRFIINDSTIQGAVNLVSPLPITQKHFADTLASSLHSKVYCHLPAWILKLSQGDIAHSLLSSPCITPAKLQNAGFKFQEAELATFLRNLLYQGQ